MPIRIARVIVGAREGWAEPPLRERLVPLTSSAQGVLSSIGAWRSVPLILGALALADTWVIFKHTDIGRRMGLASRADLYGPGFFIACAAANLVCFALARRADGSSLRASLAQATTYLAQLPARLVILAALFLLNGFFALFHTRFSVSLGFQSTRVPRLLSLTELDGPTVGTLHPQYVLAIVLWSLLLVFLFWTAANRSVREHGRAIVAFIGALSAQGVAVGAGVLVDVAALLLHTPLGPLLEIPDGPPVDAAYLLKVLLVNVSLAGLAVHLRKRSVASLLAAAIAMLRNLLEKADRHLAGAERSLGSRSVRLVRPYLAIGACVFLAHGLLLLNDGLYFEDFIFYDWLPRDPDLLYAHSGAYGLLFPIFFLHGVYCLPHNVVAFKVITFTCILVSAFLVYAISVRVGFLGQGRSVFMAVLSAVWPAHVATPFINVSYLYPCYLAFLLAAYLSLAALTWPTPLRRVTTSVALVLFFYSFVLNSLLVFYAGFLIVHAAYVHGRLGVPLPQDVRDLAWRYGHYALVPVGFWTYLNVAIPPLSFGAAHLGMRFNVLGILLGYGSLVSVLAQQVALVLLHPIALLTLLLVGAACLARRPRGHACLGESFPVRGVLVYGIALLVLGAFPYVVLSRDFDSDFESRNRFLLGLPLAVILTVVTSALCGQRRSLWGFVLLCSIAATCSVERIRAYIVYEVEAIKNHSIALQLRGMDSARATHVFGVHDMFKIERVLHAQGCASMFLHPTNAMGYVFGDFSRFAFNESDTDDPRRRYTREDMKKLTGRFRTSGFYPLRFDPQAPQATLLIQRQDHRNDDELVAEYYYIKYFRPAELDAYLQTIVRVDVIPRAPTRDE